jgi:glycosyltransferase involved in cell wall biosynthesis
MITICIPTFNRHEMVVRSFIEVIDEPIITEIIIVDDCSDLDKFEKLNFEILKLKSSKIRIFRNEENKGAFLNKLESVKKSKNDWIILIDSDNILNKDYIRSIPDILDNRCFYLPSQAICDSGLLDYRIFSGIIIEKNKFKDMSLSSDDRSNCLLNTGNYLVNKKIYLQSIELESDIKSPSALDVFYQIYLCFKNIDGFYMNVVPNMNYTHTLHKSEGEENGSYYVMNHIESNNFLSYLKKIIKENW